MAEKQFPRTEAEINAFLQNLVAKLPGYTTELGLSPGDITEITERAANFSYCLLISTQINDSKESFTEFKEEMFYGDLGKVATPPVFPVVAPPNVNNSGIVPYTRALIKRIKAAPGYTDTIGEDLGLVINDPPSISPGDIVPELKLKAINDGAIEIGFGRQGFDAIRIDYKRNGDVNWQLAGVYQSSPGIHNLAPEVPGQPEKREYRGILLKKNDAVTQYSTTYNVVTTP